MGHHQTQEATKRDVMRSSTDACWQQFSSFCMAMNTMHNTASNYYDQAMCIAMAAHGD